MGTGRGILLLDMTGVSPPRNSQKACPRVSHTHSVMDNREAPSLIEELLAGELLGKRSHFSSVGIGKFTISTKPHTQAYANNSN